MITEFPSFRALAEYSGDDYQAGQQNRGECNYLPNPVNNCGSMPNASPGTNPQNYYLPNSPVGNYWDMLNTFEQTSQQIYKGLGVEHASTGKPIKDINGMAKINAILKNIGEGNSRGGLKNITDYCQAGGYCLGHQDGYQNGFQEGFEQGLRLKFQPPYQPYQPPFLY